MSSKISSSGNYEVQYIKTDELDEHKHKIQFYSRLPLVVVRKICRTATMLYISTITL